MITIIRALRKARDEWKLIANPADRAISTDHWNQLNDTVPTSFLNRLLKEDTDVDVALAEQAPKTAALETQARRLTLYCSHFHQVLDMGIARGTFQPGARGYYGRDLGATTIPVLRSYDDLSEVANKIVAGEADRQTAEGGAYVAMQLPSAAEVNAQAAAFLAARNQSELALTATDLQREQLQAFYDEGLALAIDIWDSVEFFYRKDPDASSRRIKCERWGVVFADDAPATPTPPTPPAPTPPP